MAAATLCIQISSKPSLIKQEIEFFNASEWTTETELILLQRMHELLTIIRPIGEELHLNLIVQVADAASAVFMINKKLKGGIEINEKDRCTYSRPEGGGQEAWRLRR